jgi:hypothetical protein
MIGFSSLLLRREEKLNVVKDLPSVSRRPVPKGLPVGLCCRAFVTSLFTRVDEDPSSLFTDRTSLGLKTCAHVSLPKIYGSPVVTVIGVRQSVRSIQPCRPIARVSSTGPREKTISRDAALMHDL